jgi:hypothetical protein
MYKGWLKRITDDKGSAMVMVIVAIVFLSILGLAILSLSVSSLKVSLFDKKATLSFYMAESGLEQAYDVILTNVKGAIEAGNAAVAVSVEEYITTERERMRTELGYLSPVIDGGDPDGPIKQEVIDDKLTQALPSDSDYQRWLKSFQDEYRLHLNYCLLDELNKPGNYQAVGAISGAKPPTIQVKNSSLFSDPNSDTECDITLKSIYDTEKYQDKAIPQEVQMKFNLKVPDKIPGEVQLETTTTTTPSTPPGGVVYDNPIFDNVLISTDNIVIDYTNLKLNINGNVYAYGNNVKDPSKLHSYGGFTLRKDNQQVTINGDFVTNENLQHKGDIVLKPDGSPKYQYVATNSKITVTKDVYAENIVINERRYGTIPSDHDLKNTITVQGNAYTSEDLILNGTNKITINNWFKTSVSQQLIKPEILSLGPDVGISVNQTKNCTPAQEASLTFKQQQYSNTNLRKYICDAYFTKPYGLILAYGGTTSINTNPDADGLIDFPTTKNNHRIDNLFWMTNSDKQLFILGPNHNYDPKASGSKWNPANMVAVYVKKDFNGIIVHKGQVRIYGDINMKGMIISQNCILFCDPHEKTITEDLQARKKILDEVDDCITLAEEMYNKFGGSEPPQRPFLDCPPAGSESFWPDPTAGGGTGGTVTETTVTGSTVTGNVLSEDFIKNLIVVSDWEKIK